MEYTFPLAAAYFIVAFTVYMVRKYVNFYKDAKPEFNSGVSVFWLLCFIGIIIRDFWFISNKYVKSFKETA